MTRDVDVQKLLAVYAQRAKSASIPYRAFAQAVQRQASASDQTVPVYRDLAVNPDVVLVPRLYQLSRDGKLSIESSGNQIERVILPDFYVDALRAEYRRMDESPDVPFPDEEALKLGIPPEWIQSVSIDTDLPSLIEAEGARRTPFYRLVFPDGVRPFIVMSEMVGEKLLELAVLKIRQYLRRGSNKDFVQHKLAYAFPAKESQLKDYLQSILIKPYDVARELRSGGSDFSFPCWAYLTSYVKQDVMKKNDKTPEEWSSVQAAWLVDVYNNHYKGKAQREADREAALKALEQAIRKPPYHWALDDVLAFRDSKGQPLLGKYSKEEFEEWYRVQTTEAEPGRLPRLLVVVTAQGQRWFVPKDRALMLALKLVGDARSSIRARLLEDWRAALEEFSNLPAMESDERFREELAARLTRTSPILAALVSERILPLVHDELSGSGESPAELERLFYRGDLVSLEGLLELHRKQLLVDARNLLPIWYSIPIVSAIVALFVRRKARQRKERRAVRQTEEKATTKSAGKPSADRRVEFAMQAERVAAQILPKGADLEEYLGVLIGRWNTMINLEAKNNLTEDVNVLVRDYLRGLMRTLKPSELTRERVEALASTLSDTPNLLKIRNHAALEEYITLYMLFALRR